MANKKAEIQQTSNQKPDREDKFKTHRLIQIDKWIRSGAYPSVEKMRVKYGVSRRTILRDMEFLRDRYDAPLEYDKIRKGYYYTDPTFMIQNVLLTEGDLFTVSTVMPLLEQYKNTPLENSFRNIMAKIAEMLPTKVWVDTSFLNKDISFIRDPLPKIDEQVFNSVFKAVKLQCVLEFSYRSVSSQEFKDKTFDPYHVLCQKGNWYVLGFDHAANDSRIYALSRMKNISILKTRFEIPPDFDPSHHVDLSFGIWNNTEQIAEYELVFDSTLANYITEREWHKNQTVVLNPDGTVTLCFTSNQKQQIFSWVLSFGTAVTVKKPESLAEDLRAEVAKLAEKYKLLP
ncbi:MAG: WYL domain-containing protein [Spirochaetaceae bacterium]|nr:WYL domain-containing protein [Spirochaetaceae bacterium]